MNSVGTRRDERVARQKTGKRRDNMMKKVLIWVTVGLLAGLLLVSVAFAQEDETDRSHAGEGTLTAQGDGIALLAGRGTADLTGNGILWVKDFDTGAVFAVTGFGEREEFEDGWIQFSGFDGEAHLEGNRILVIVSGVDIDLEAHGRGFARLWGHGSYQNSGGDSEWNTRRGGAPARIGAGVPGANAPDGTILPY
jgi:hypothetical protein